jgi:hypothetical protein
MVVIARCCSQPNEYGLGQCFTVSHLEHHDDSVVWRPCGACGNFNCGGTQYAVFEDPRAVQGKLIRMAPVPWLIRIDPPEEMKCEENTSSIPATDRTTPAAPTKSPERVS